MQKGQRISTKVILGATVAALALVAQQGEPKPTCRHCSATYIPVSELDAYTAKALLGRPERAPHGAVRLARSRPGT